jgi:hypothetical protein
MIPMLGFLFGEGLAMGGEGAQQSNSSAHRKVVQRVYDVAAALSFRNPPSGLKTEVTLADDAFSGRLVPHACTQMCSQFRFWASLAEVSECRGLAL